MNPPLRAFAFSFFALAVSSPAVFAQPVVSVVNTAPAGSVASGQMVSMGVSATGTSLGYQWQLNGANVPGATAATYTMMAGAADAGTYQVVVSSGGSSTTVAMGTLHLMPSDARLMNLSARGMAGTGANAMITGFVSSGDSSTNKNVLIRGMGPSLAGVMGGMMSGLLSNPVLTLYDGQSHPMGGDMGWTNAPTTSGGSAVHATLMPATMSMMTALGAFAPTSGSADSALMMSAPPGLYTAIVNGANGMSGIALAECYDADAVAGATNTGARLINISARANVGSGSNALIAGFVIGAGPSGSPITVLIRAMGPSLTALGMTGVLMNPTLTLYDANSKPIAANTGWTNLPSVSTGATASPVHAGVEAATTSIMTRVGAFGPMAGATDSAMVATLPPGTYSAVVTDGSGQNLTGIALVEVYEIR